MELYISTNGEAVVPRQFTVQAISMNILITYLIPISLVLGPLLFAISVLLVNLYQCHTILIIIGLL